MPLARPISLERQLTPVTLVRLMRGVNRVNRAQLIGVRRLSDTCSLGSSAPERAMSAAQAGIRAAIATVARIPKRAPC